VTSPRDVGLEPGVGLARQTEIYLAGVRGRRQAIPFGHEQLERAARGRMSPQAFAYVAGGAGAERTIAANRAAFDRHRIVPRVLRDVSGRDLSVELLGRRLPTPFLLAPIGVLELAHKDADVAVARAAAAEGVPMIFSNQASRPMEECAAAMGDAPRWFQLYWSTSDELVASFVRRAEACGCGAIVVTLDTKMLGWRSRDLDFAHLPFATASVDACTGHSFLYLVADRSGVLSEIRRGLRPGGRLVLMEPNGRGVTPRQALAVSHDVRHLVSVSLWRPFSRLHGRFTPTSLSSTLAHAGFVDCHVEEALGGLGLLVSATRP